METSGESAVIDALLAIEREEVTGILEVSAQGVSTNIYARSGEIVFADGGAIGETLGRVLIRAGRLTEEQVAAVIRRMTDALADGEHLRFGQIAVDYGFLDAGELDLALTQQVREKLIGCIHRGRARWKLSRNDARLGNVGAYVVRTRPMLVEGAAHLPERRLEEVLHLDENRYPEIVAPETVVAAEFELSKDEARILRDLDGTSSIHFILSKAPSPSVMPLLAALVLGGGVELKVAPTGMRHSSEARPIPPEFRTARRARFVRPEDGTTTAPMAMPPGAKASASSAAVAGAISQRPPTASARLSAVSFSTIEVPEAERRSARQHLPPPTAEAKVRARDALERLRTDLERTKATSNRERWPEPRDERERRLMAEAAFHQGRSFLRMAQAAQALPGLHRAFELCPDQREYELHLKWAQMLVNDTFGEDGPRSAIRTLAAMAVKEDRNCDLGFGILGHCAMHEGKEAAALRFFQRAASLDPKLADAARVAGLLAIRAESEPRRPSFIDAQKRAKARGQLDALLDEVVPLLFQQAAELPPSGGATPKTTDPPLANGPSQVVVPAPRASPDGTLEVLPPPPPGVPVERRAQPTPPGPPVAPEPSTATRDGASATAARDGEAAVATRDGEATAATRDGEATATASVPPPSLAPVPPATASVPPPSLPPVPPGELSPPQPSSRPPSREMGDLVSTREPTTASPLAASVPMTVTQPLVPQRPASALRAVAPPSRSVSVPREDRPAERAPRRRTALLVAWIASLGLSATAAYVIGSRTLFEPEPAVTTIDGARTLSSSITEPTVSSPPPPASLTSSAPAASVAGSPTSSSSMLTSPSATASSEVPARTGILKTPKGVGRRVYVDGRVIGEGREHTVACGRHRIRVGSTGLERSVTIPCGGTIELD